MNWWCPQDRHTVGISSTRLLMCTHMRAHTQMQMHTTRSDTHTLSHIQHTQRQTRNFTHADTNSYLCQQSATSACIFCEQSAFAVMCKSSLRTFSPYVSSSITRPCMPSNAVGDSPCWIIPAWQNVWEQEAGKGWSRHGMSQSSRTCLTTLSTLTVYYSVHSDIII